MGVIGSRFDRTAEVTERLHQAPGEAARVAIAATPDGPPPSRWTLRGIRATFPWLTGYSLSGVWRALHRNGCRVRAARVRHYSPDPAYVEKVLHLEACLQEAGQHPTRVALVFLDEMGYTRWPEAADDWRSAVPADQPVTERAGTNNQQWRIIGALNAHTGQVDCLDAYIVGRARVIQFYQQLVRAYPDAERLYVVQDNWSIHRHEEVVAALVTMPQIEIVWLPTYAPWLNPIEKLWRWLRQDVLKQHRLAGDWNGLHQRVRQFLAQFKQGSQAVLHYVGLLGDGKLAQALHPQ